MEFVVTHFSQLQLGQLENFTVELLSEGVTSLVYKLTKKEDGTAYALKVCFPNESSIASLIGNKSYGDVEIRFYRENGHLEFIPKLLSWTAFEGGYIALLEFLEHSSKVVSEQEAALVISRMHQEGTISEKCETGLLHDCWHLLEKHYGNNFLQHLNPHQTLSSLFPLAYKHFQQSNYFDKWIASLAKTLVHGDYRPANLIKTAHVLKIIDFQLCHFGHPAEDLGVFLSTSELDIDQFCQLYCENNRTECYENLCNWVYVFVLLATSIPLCLKCFYGEPEIIEHADQWLHNIEHKLKSKKNINDVILNMLNLRNKMN